MFTEHGLGGSMRQIALQAGVSEPTLRRRFPCREELVLKRSRTRSPFTLTRPSRRLRSRPGLWCSPDAAAGGRGKSGCVPSDLSAHDRGDLGAQELDRAHDVCVAQVADRELQHHAVVTELLVLKQQLVRDLLR